LKSILFVTKFPNRFLQVFGSRSLNRLRQKTRPNKPRPRPLFAKSYKNIEKRAGFYLKNPRSRPAPRDYLIICSGCFARSHLRRRPQKIAKPRPARRRSCSRCVAAGFAA
jgi:hypothetical protein